MKSLIVNPFYLPIGFTLNVGLAYCDLLAWWA